jgi:hypothetical protein
MKRTLILLVLVILLALPAVPALAQSQNPPVDPNSAWGEVVDSNGNILYSNLTDLGPVQKSASWMPGIPGIGNLQASYHEYQTPSGNIVVMPTATTLFFMALNPQASGMAQASSQLGVGAAGTLEAAGIIKGMLQGYIDPTALAQAMSTKGYVDQSQFFSDVINNDPQELWSLLGKNTVGFLTSLINQSKIDKSLYTTLLLYTPDQCFDVPGGCPANASLPVAPAPAAPTPPASSCSSPIVKSGAITVTASKIAPPYPLVVGQDDARRGVDLTWKVTVGPTLYTYGVRVPVVTNVCSPWNGTGPSNCKTPAGLAGVLHSSTSYVCQQRTTTYTEGLQWVTPSASLSQTSRDWILNTLSIMYPRAYLHHPDFSFAAFPDTGSFQGSTFVLDFSQTHVQVADPGTFDLGVAGATTGTPVSNWRGFSKSGGSFPVYLEEAVIIK